MSAGVSQMPLTGGTVRRRVPRYPMAVPVDVTVLRSGIPDSIPGRALDLGEGGVGAVMASELRMGETVGIEFRLPFMGMPVRAKARVRHQDRLRCGLEFQGLSEEQQATIRYFAREMVRPQRTERAGRADQPVMSTLTPEEPLLEPRRRRAALHVLWMLAAIMIAGAILGWWHWEQAWRELESRLPHARIETPVEPLRITIPAQALAPLVTRKVDPVYPSGTERVAHGTVLLQAIIGRDGAVVNLRPVSGPEMLSVAAMDAVKLWRFQPYRVNGEPAEVETTVAVEFQ